jgi:hypothetical protein
MKILARKAKGCALTAHFAKIKCSFGLAMAFLIPLAATGSPNLVSNPGFEADCNFSSEAFPPISPPEWYLSPAPVSSLVVGFQAPNAHTGDCAAAFGAFGGYDDTIAQMISTMPAVYYRVSFWAERIDHQDPETPYHLVVTFANETVLDTTSLLTGTFSEFSATIRATEAGSWLSIAGRNQPGFVVVDDFSVVPEPATLALVGLGLGLASLPSLRRRS